METSDKMNILLVDDSAPKLYVLQNQLKPLNQNIVTARSGEEALRLLLKQEFGLILLDVRMPGMDGFETAELIRQRKSSEYIPIIFITGIDRSETQIFKGYSLGAVDYLFTPVVREVLLAKVTVFIELHRKTQEIKRSRQLLAQAQQIARLGSWEWELGTGMLRWSEEFSRIFGLSITELESPIAGLAHFIHPGDLDEVRSRIAKARRRGVATSLEFRIRRKDHAVRHVCVRSEPVHGSSGRVTHLFGTLLDITERKVSEEALRASEEKFRSVAETALSAIITMKQDGRIIYANQSAERLFDYPRDGMLGQPFSSLIPEKIHSFPAIREFRSPEISGLLGKTLVLRGRKKSAKEFPIELSLAAWKSHGEALFTAVISDITEREAAERKIAAEVQERKAAEEKILEISGREQCRLGQELHDGIGQTLTGISFLSKVLSTKLRDRSDELAGDAQRICDLVSDAIGKTRDLARGFYPVEIESNGLVSALQELAAREQNLFRVKCDLETIETAAVGDLNKATQVYRIAQEAIENAIKHGKAKKITIKLLRNDGRLHLSVSDDGIGLPKALPAKRGMGLQIMKYRASMLQGTFEVRRQARRGTLVACSFPDPSANKV